MQPQTSEVIPYINNNLGIQVVLSEWRDAYRLPVYLRQNYQYYETRILGTKLLMMMDKNDKEQPATTVLKHLEQTRVKWDGEILYVRSRITAYNRKRLIEQKIPFVVPGNQMYIPMLGIDLREHFKKVKSQIQKFSPATQALFFNLVLPGQVKEEMKAEQMVKRLGYSNMTITRAFDELETAGVAESFQRTRERYIKLGGFARDCWEKALPFLSSPVKRTSHIRPIPNDFHSGLRAGLTALSDYTMMTEPANPVLAMSSEDWKLLRQRHQIELIPTAEPGLNEIEVWSYSPKLLAEGNTVDRLSLYLSLKESNDERIESALQELIVGLKW